MANSGRIPQVIINERSAARLRAGHVWVYASDLLDDGAAAAGSLAHVFNAKGQLLGSGLYSSASQIRLRLVSSRALASETELLELLSGRLQQAVAYRGRVVRDSNACRLVFSEADGLPGLVVDRFNDLLTFQILTQAWDRTERRALLLERLPELTGLSNIIERVDERIRSLEQLPPLETRPVQGTRTQTTITMNGIRSHYEAGAGQKTGAFLDQRENYAAAAQLAHGRALDVCTYQGGFALHLARACEAVTAIDLSRPALERGEQNEALNADVPATPIEWIEANAFDLLRDYSDAGRHYDTIVLDPPAFARSKKQLAAAMRGYKELNLLAMKMLRPGGLLVTCSCSFAVSEEAFLDMLGASARDAHARVRIIERRTQAKDHPVLLGVPETFYLKCILCIVG